MPAGSDMPPTSDDSPSHDPPPRRVRFEQARSIGILLVLSVLLALVLFNTLAEGTPWVNRDRDVRLLMALLSILLGLDVLVGNRRALATLLARALLQYADDTTDHPRRRPDLPPESASPRRERERTPPRADSHDSTSPSTPPPTSRSHPPPTDDPHPDDTADEADDA